MTTTESTEAANGNGQVQIDAQEYINSMHNQIARLSVSNADELAKLQSINKKLNDENATLRQQIDELSKSIDSSKGSVITEEKTQDPAYNSASDYVA